MHNREDLNDDEPITDDELHSDNEQQGQQRLVITTGSQSHTSSQWLNRLFPQQDVRSLMVGASRRRAEMNIEIEDEYNQPSSPRQGR